MSIQVQHLNKQFKVHVRQEGWADAVRSLFRREYRTVDAVKDVSFSIESGEIVGFLGPNGAGKTTTMKMLAGLLHPTSGQITVGGFKPLEQKNEFKKMMSLVMGQKSQLIWDIPPMETFLVNKAIYEIEDRVFRQTLDELTELLELEPLLTKPTRSLSLGQRMKCELAAALLHRPTILFLDEPTIGLDVHTQEKVRKFIAKYNREHQTTILLTSHYMGDVTALCNRVLIINHGKLLYDGDLQVLTEKLTPYKLLEIRLPSLPAVSWDNYGEIVHIEEGRVTLRVPRERIPEVSSKLLQNFHVSDLNIQDPPMEEVITLAFQEESHVQ
ncbi:ATP-binding cassette domain-containing protein [Aneurinibacillus sp. Ricciae_BoGa-3]|uniref:ABC transporter ATP-binding protein n=1 Tax=Aneurinibacillus sp. Ricciae_BoGa-3 TaxID=3022697 RepID=UPI002341B669|nr:ATP-binding cassette domain-containing protein [Aneurinibacillus sp. Ricciae_BoGa-3]WCK53181.1 ATP-binding cassette domain-containing protein [Aneurinibacillus sp. Ricciae_BoGa-3]